MKKVRILWSGITGRTGVEALKAAQDCKYAEIVAGVSRSGKNGCYTYEQLDSIKEEFDVIVDFSHKDSYDAVLDFALKVKKPLIIGTAGLSEQQLDSFQKASKTIPIFRGGNFRWAVKTFIDEVLEYAKTHDNLKLVERHYKTKKIPSETAKVVANKVFKKYGKTVEIESHLEYDELINDWQVDDLHCRVVGFKELGEDVLKIASMFANKKADGVYDLDRLFELEKNNELVCDLTPKSSQKCDAKNPVR